MTRHIHALCEEVWTAREGGLVIDALTLSQKLTVAAACDVADHPRYDPETDERMAWLREIAAQVRRRPSRSPRADANLEFRVQMLIGKWALIPCGKDLAARN